jgi:hypothetical protein
MQNSPSYFNHTHLSEQELQNPMLTIRHFCELFPPAIARNILWLWLSETLAAEDTHYENAQHRADLLLFFNELQKLLDANYLLHAPAEQLSLAS